MSLQVDILNLKNKAVEKLDLDSDVFGVELNKSVLHTVVKWQLASRRQGTHMTKTRGLVSGGGKKPFKQKGTGSARQGSTRSPLMPGGGKLFGPVPRDYSYTLPKKVRTLGLKMALSSALQNKKLFILDDLKATGKTKEIRKDLLQFSQKSVVVDDKSNVSASRAIKNLKKFNFLPPEGVNVYDLLKYESLIITKKALFDLVSRVRGN